MLKMIREFQEEISLSGRVFKVNMIHQKRKTIYYYFSNGAFYVKCSPKVPFDFIKGLLEKKGIGLIALSDSRESLNYSIETELVRIKGIMYPLVVEESKVNKAIWNNQLHIILKKQEDFSKVIDQFYRILTMKMVNDILIGLNPILINKGMVPLKITYRKVKRRWGCCKMPKRELNFSIELSKLKSDLVYYVVVHELCHLKEMNHGKRFHELVEQLCPNHQELEKEMKRFMVE